jgi:hypothetical protein
MALAGSVVQLSECQIKTPHSTDFPLEGTVSLERGYVRCLTIVCVPYVLLLYSFSGAVKLWFI